MSQSIVNEFILSYLGGALALASPCLAPTLVGFLSFIVCSAIFSNTKSGRKVFLTSLFFGTGLSLVFLIGIVPSQVQILLMDSYQLTAKITGATAMAFGLVFLFRSENSEILAEEESTKTRNAPLGLPGAFIVGALFGAAWAHCLGPILGAILNMSFVPESAARGIFLLIVYAAGLTSSFALAGLALSRLLALFLDRASQELRMKALTVAGVTLTAVGVSLIFTTQWLAINRIFIGLAGNSPTSRLEILLMQLLR